jgi:hypothetical protein
MNLLTNTQFNQQIFSHIKPYHLQINSWHNLYFKECSGTAIIHIHEPVESLILENCHFDNLVINTQRLMGKIILINCSGHITLSSQDKQNLDIEIQGKNQARLILRKWTVSRQIFVHLIEQHYETLIFEQCFFNKVRLSNQDIGYLGLYKCEGNLHLKSDKLHNILKLDIRTQNKLWGKKFVFHINGYHVHDCNMEARSFIKETQQKFLFSHGTIESFNINDSSFFLPYIQSWMNIVFGILMLFLFLNTFNLSNEEAKKIFIFSIIVSSLEFIFLADTKKSKICFFLFGLFMLFLTHLTSNVKTPGLIFCFYSFCFISIVIIPMSFLVWYNFSGSASNISLTLRKNRIEKIAIIKKTFKSENNRLLHLIGEVIFGTLNYFLNGRFFNISFQNNQIQLFDINNDGFSHEDKIIFLYEQPGIRINKLNFLSLGKENIFYKKILEHYEKRHTYLSDIIDNPFSGIAKLLYLFVVTSLTSHFIRVKNLFLSLLCTVLIGAFLIFTSNNVTIKDNNVQLEILKAKNSHNNLCQSECTTYFNDKDNKETKISVPDFYDKYNPYYFTINELINLPLLETNKSFKPNNNSTEFFSFIYHCLGLIYTSAFVWHLGKFIFFKKNEVEIEEKEED